MAYALSHILMMILTFSSWLFLGWWSASVLQLVSLAWSNQCALYCSCSVLDNLLCTLWMLWEVYSKDQWVCQHKTQLNLWNHVVERVRLQDSGFPPIPAFHWDQLHPAKKKGKKRKKVYLSVTTTWIIIVLYPHYKLFNYFLEHAQLFKLPSLYLDLHSLHSIVACCFVIYSQRLIVLLT